MPAGIKPKAAIEKVFGQFFREVNFEPVKSFPPESYRYGRKEDDGPRRIEFDFNWTSPALLRELNGVSPKWLQDDDFLSHYKHSLWVAFRWKDKIAGILPLIRDKVWQEKCPYIAELYDPVSGKPQLTPEEKNELHAAWDNDPVVRALVTNDWEFLTQKDLERVLELYLWAIREHDLIRWLEAQEQQGQGTQETEGRSQPCP